jgi:WD40 repeat protein
VLNRDCFVTASQDSNVFLWNIKKKKPIFKCNEAHGKNWITSLGVFPSLDIFATGSLNNLINIYQVSPDMKRF